MLLRHIHHYHDDDDGPWHSMRANALNGQSVPAHRDILTIVRLYARNRPKREHFTYRLRNLDDGPHLWPFREISNRFFPWKLARGRRKCPIRYSRRFDSAWNVPSCLFVVNFLLAFFECPYGGSSCVNSNGLWGHRDLFGIAINVGDTDFRKFIVGQ